MPIKFNFNLCDNSPECSGKAVCPAGAIYWDEASINALGNPGVLCVDNNKCVSCGKCVGEEGCPVGAIIFAPTESELADITSDLEVDLDEVKKLFVDRYGAEPINTCISADEVQTVIENSNGEVILLEEYADWSIQCLLASIPINLLVKKVHELTQIDNIKYVKCEKIDAEPEKEHLPSLQIYKDGILIGRIDGYFDNTQEADFFASLEELFKRT